MFLYLSSAEIRYKAMYVDCQCAYYSFSSWHVHEFLDFAEEERKIMFGEIQFHFVKMVHSFNNRTHGVNRIKGALKVNEYAWNVFLPEVFFDKQLQYN